uniref:UDENN domain-containing protein n=3 Tax=Anguilla anguilla TaxID=7936 RepID=A0A0E9QUV4_ANGAN
MFFKRQIFTVLWFPCPSMSLLHHCLSPSLLSLMAPIPLLHLLHPLTSYPLPFNLGHLPSYEFCDTLCIIKLGLLCLVFLLLLL